jgi:hypothetical protein
MRFPSFNTINVQYNTYLSYNVYRNSDSLLLGTLTRNSKYLFDWSFASGATQTIVSTSSALSADIWLAKDCINSSDSGDSY